jgi:flagellar hook-associated protein 2
MNSREKLEMAKQLAALGVDSNGNDNTLALGDGSKLDAALATNLSGVRDLFSNSTNGIAVRLDSYLEATIGDNGSLVNHQSTLTKQVSDIDTQISDAERLVQDNRQRLIDSFVAMEAAQAQINQQLQFLAQRFGNSSTQ